MPTRTQAGALDASGAGRGMGPPRTDSDRASRAVEIVNSLRKDFSQRDELYRDIDAVLYQEIDPDIPEAYRATAEIVKSPLAIHMASTITAALSVNPFQVQFQPVGTGDSHQTNASEREHFFEASWARQEAESREQLFRQFMWSLVTKGEAIFKTVERSKRVWTPYGRYAKRELDRLNDPKDPEYGALDRKAAQRKWDQDTEEYKRARLPYPISTSVVLPESFYYLKNEDGFTHIAEVKQVPYLEALDRFGARLTKAGTVLSREQWQPDPSALGLPREDAYHGMSGLSYLTLVESWDGATGECTYLLSGPGQTSSQSETLGTATVVRRYQHGYSDPFLKTLRGPYAHARGTTTASRLPHRAGLGVLYGFLPLFPLLDRLLTIKDNAAHLTGFPTFKRNQPPGAMLPDTGYGNDGTGSDAEESWAPGDIMPYDMGPVEMPRSGADLDQFITLVRSFLELALPSVVQGVISGDESGYALNQAAYLARLGWDPLVSNAESACGDRVGFESWLIEHRIGERVYAWGGPVKSGARVTKAAGWRGIGPDDLGGVHRYTCKLQPETPSNEVVQTRAIGEKLKLRLITPDEAIEASGGNPDEVNRGWLIHDLKQDPRIVAMIKDGVFDTLGTIDKEANTKIDAILSSFPGAERLSGGLPGGAPDIGGVFAPGQGMPLVPTPGGAVTGVGPGGQPGLPAGMPPGTQGAPPSFEPLPGGGPY